MATSTTASETETDPCTLWINLSDQDVTVDSVSNILKPIKDDLWVVGACVDRLAPYVPVQRALLDLSLERTEGAVNRSRDAFLDSSTPTDGAQNIVDGQDSRSEGRDASLLSYFSSEQTDAQICKLRSVLLDRLDRLNTFLEICKVSPPKQDGSEDEIDEGWEDDPWAETEADENASESPQIQKSSSKSSAVLGEPPVSLSLFLTDDLGFTSCFLASTERFAALKILMLRHGAYLWPYRFTILECIPEHSDPEEYRDFLPGHDPSTNHEQMSGFQPWRPELDWTELPEVLAALDASGASFGSEVSVSRIQGVARHDPLTSSELTSWYTMRIDDIISSCGMVDVALTLVQHGGAKGVPNLDELGEDLNLLYRLVYDAPRSTEPGDGTEDYDDWTLSRWRSMDPLSIIRAYLAHSSPSTIVKDIRTLIMPYVFVLESRAERAGNPDPSMSSRLLYDTILSLPLEMAAVVFEASKPTLPVAQRLIKNDEDVARLALACLYGSDSLDEWATMSRIFECLPAWENALDEEDEADTTIVSLGAFVTPSTTRPRCTASDLLVFFSPLPSTSLSRALDVLDVHLESGEILARWNVPAPLRWFLQSGSDVGEQRAWANRMARRAAGSRGEMDTEEEWEWLLEDMLKLAGKGDGGLKGAFGLLSREEVMRVYLSGLLSSGKFNVAKNILNSPKRLLRLDAEVIEDICLSCSHEFYDNASSGNYKFGDMKLAYDCLDVPHTTERVAKEKEFIEATSRLSSFNITSRPGILISPIEIRLTKDRLSLVSQVLSSNPDAYKHAEVILDLVYKLGFRGDLTAEVKTYAMLADTALQAEDFNRAYEIIQTMVNVVNKLRSSVPPGIEDPRIQESSEVCWVACFQLGRQSEFPDIDKKMRLLGRALELCPPDRLPDNLNVWHRLEMEDIENRRERLASRRTGGDPLSRKRSTKAGRSAPSLSERLQHLHMPDLHMPSSPLVPLVSPDAAALASRTFHRVAANFPFSVRNRTRSPDSDGSNSRSRDGSRTRFASDEVSAQASRVFQKGIGWLIGADEDA